MILSHRLDSLSPFDAVVIIITNNRDFSFVLFSVWPVDIGLCYCLLQFTTVVAWFYFRLWILIRFSYQIQLANYFLFRETEKKESRNALAKLVKFFSLTQKLDLMILCSSKIGDNVRFGCDTYLRFVIAIKHDDANKYKYVQ